MSIKHIIACSAAVLTAALVSMPSAQAQGTARFDPDNEKSAIGWEQLTAKFGPVPKASAGLKVGSIMKFLGNPYWTLLSKGMVSEGKKFGVTVDVQAAQSESDQAGQLANMETMISKKYNAFMVSPQSDTNLLPSVAQARSKKILVVNVDDAVLPDAEHFVGPMQYENGVRAAKYFIATYGKGGKVAVIEGQAGAYAAKQRTKGFKETLAKSSLTIVASVPGDWDRQKSMDAATTIMQQYPDLLGFYCNNDGMALGVVEAARGAKKLGALTIIGTDGIGEAYDSIRAGELTGTVDSFPEHTGQVALDVVLRILGGQKIPRVVYSPQNLITRKNIDNTQAPGF
jgi:ribose transport system substrate-binding protein